MIRYYQEVNKQVLKVTKQQEVELQRSCHQSGLVEGSAVQMSGGVHQAGPSFFHNQISNILAPADLQNQNRQAQMKKAKELADQLVLQSEKIEKHADNENEMQIRRRLN